MTEQRLAADFTDRLACPECGYPMQRIGRWYIREGQWYFTAEVMSARKTRHERPGRDGHRWSDIPRKIEKVDAYGIVTTKTEAEWHYLVTHICTRSAHDSYDCNISPLQAEDCVPYRGEVFDWMLPPGDTLVVPEVKHEIDRVTQAAGGVR